MSIKFHQLLSFAKFREFLVQYHKVAKEEFDITPLGINKALIVASKVFGYNTHHQMIHEHSDKQNLLKVRVEIITVSYMEKVDDYQWSTNVTTFSDRDEMDSHLKSLFSSEVSSNDTDPDELISQFDLEDDEDDELFFSQMESHEIISWLEENVNGMELVDKIESLSFERAKVDVSFNYVNIDIKETDII